MTDQTQPMLPDDIDKLVAGYVRLRDRIKEEDDKHKERMARAREMLETMNNHMLERLNVIGADSISTDVGTVYRTARRSATIADSNAFRQYVMTNSAFDIVDMKANAPAVDDFIKKHGSPPPGVNYNTAYVVGVRRK